ANIVTQELRAPPPRGDCLRTLLNAALAAILVICSRQSLPPARRSALCARKRHEAGSANEKSLRIAVVEVVVGASALLTAYLVLRPGLADTMEAALVRAYQHNPQLNAQRAAVRSSDESVPQALSGYRPRVALTASAGYQYNDSTMTQGGSP